MRNNIIKKPRRICKKFNAVFLLVLACLCLYSCHSQEQSYVSFPESYRIEDEEYDVMSAVIKSEYIEEKTQLVIINKFTNIIPVYNKYDYRFFLGGILRIGDALGDGKQRRLFIHEIGADTLRDFENKSLHILPLEYKFKLNLRYLLEEIVRDDEEEWESKLVFLSEFYRRYPGSAGIITFSRVGFNNEKTKALVYYGHKIQEGAGMGRLLYLQKSSGTWIIRKQSVIWFS